MSSKDENIKEGEEEKEMNNNEEDELGEEEDWCGVAATDTSTEYIEPTTLTTTKTAMEKNMSKKTLTEEIHYDGITAGKTTAVVSDSDDNDETKQMDVVRTTATTEATTAVTDEENTAAKNKFVRSLSINTDNCANESDSYSDVAVTPMNYENNGDMMELNVAYESLETTR
eukprot:11213582-Ditylum_brightwellii.AAC.1